MILNNSTCYLNIYPEKKGVAETSLYSIKKKNKNIWLSKLSFQIPYKFKTENTILKGLMFILVFSFKLVFLFNLTNIIDCLLCARLRDNDWDNWLCPYGYLFRLFMWYLHSIVR